MEDHLKKYYPSYPPEPPEQREMLDFLPLPVRISIFVILALPMIPLLLITYLVSMPIERIIFHASGYAKLYPKYYWLLTKSTHYKIYKRYSKSYFAYYSDFHKKVMYVYEKNEVLNFVLCDFDGMYYWEKENDWLIKGGHGSISFAAFYAMEQFANEQYPKRNKQYFICLSKADIKHGKNEQDERLIKISDVKNLIQ